MLHQLAEQAPIVRKAYADFDYKTVVARLAAFMNTELSAFYFDIRKDTLYCDPPSSLARKAALTTIDMLCDAILKWLAPVLSLHRRRSMADVPAGRRAVGASDAVPGRPRAVSRRRAGREVGDHPQRPPRRHRRAGARTRRQAHRLLAGGLADHLCRRPRRCSATLFDVDLAEVCITSNYEVREGEAPADAFRLTTCPASPSWSRRPSAPNAPAPGRSCRPSARTRNIPTSRRATRRRCANGRRWE